MCTLALYFRLSDDHPLLVAANRDEHYDRPSAAPALLGADPIILAGKDLVAGGTWLGVNEYGLVCGILNRKLANERATPMPTRSRGLLCMDLLRLKSAAAALHFVVSHEERYQPFTVLYADSREAWTAYNVEREIKTIRLDPGLHVFSNTAEFSAQTEKLARAHRQFSGLVAQFQSSPSESWIATLAHMLGDHTLGAGSGDPREAICVHGEVSGTVSSSIIFYSASDRRFHGLHSPGPPCRTPFGEALTLTVR